MRHDENAFVYIVGLCGRLFVGVNVCICYFFPTLRVLFFNLFMDKQCVLQAFLLLSQFWYRREVKIIIVARDYAICIPLTFEHVSSHLITCHHDVGPNFWPCWTWARIAVP